MKYEIRGVYFPEILRSFSSVRMIFECVGPWILRVWESHSFCSLSGHAPIIFIDSIPILIL